MFFKPKFFLDLSGEGDKAPEPARIAPVETAPERKAPSAAAAASPAKPAGEPAALQAPAAVGTAAAATPAAPVSGMTTAEAIAAELAAAQADRPAPNLATFAPDCLVPGSANPPRRRRAGANLAGFKEIARSYLKA